MIWILVYFIVLLLFLWVIDRCFKNEQFDRIPGPKGLFLFGNGFDFIGDSVKIFYLFRYLSNKYHRLYKLKLGPKKFLVLQHPEDVESVISGSKNTKKGYLYRFLKPWLKDGLLLSYDEKWYHRRKILTPAFHFNVLQHYKKIFEEGSLKLIETLKHELDNPEINISEHVSDCALNIICESAMGIKLDSQSIEFSKKYKKGIHIFGELTYYRIVRIWFYIDKVFSWSSKGRKMKEILDLLAVFRDKVISKRKKEAARPITTVNADEFDDDDDVYRKKRLAMLDLLLKAEKEGHIDQQGICEEVDTFMFEGHDTVATSLQYLLMLLANNPESQEKVVGELNQIFETSDRQPTNEDLRNMKYLECCIKESLRLYPPVYFIIRRIDQDTQIRDYTIPAGTDCGILTLDMHRRPDQFVKPLEFLPERFASEPTWHPYAYIPFSAGPRNCIGQRFAMMEIKIIVSALLRRYKLLPVTKPEDLIHITDLILRTKNPILIKIEVR